MTSVRFKFGLPQSSIQIIFFGKSECCTSLRDLFKDAQQKKNSRGKSWAPGMIQIHDHKLCNVSNESDVINLRGGLWSVCGHGLQEILHMCCRVYCRRYNHSPIYHTTRLSSQRAATFPDLFLTPLKQSFLCDLFFWSSESKQPELFYLNRVRKTLAGAAHFEKERTVGGRIEKQMLTLSLLARPSIHVDRKV